MTPAILFQDRRFLIIDKPAGLPVHPGRSGGASIEDFFPAWRLGSRGPWLAHRLDQDTSGCLLIALKKSALLAAQALFAGNKVEKTYWAIVQGTPSERHGVIDAPLAKQTTGNHWKMVAGATGQPAVTHWQVKAHGPNHSWLEFSPKTGRTHQIRAHAALIGHPITGDAIYGGGQGKLCLLARAIALPLNPPAAAAAPPPAHMLEKLKLWGHGKS